MTNFARRTFKFLGAAGATLALAASPSAVSAQATGTAGFALDRYEPTPAGDLFFAADFPRYNGFPFPALSVIGEYVRNPLVLRSGDTRTSSVIENMVLLHVQGSFALFNRVEINASVPISLLQTGDSSNAASTGLAPYGDPVTGDVRVGLRGRIVGEADRSPISLHLGFYGFLGFIPYNAREHHVTDEDFRFKAYAVLAGHPGPIRWSLTAGYHFRPTTVLPGLSTTVDDDVFINAAVGVAFANNHVTIGPEGWFAIQIDPGRPVTAQRRLGGEALLGAHFLLGDRILLSAAGGLGFAELVGIPEARALLRLSYAPEPQPTAPPPPADTDTDGVLDRDDLCPAVPMGAHPDPARRGCPIGDRDRDTVLDNEDRCIDEPQGAHPDPDPARRGCPEGDRDHDTVLDSADQCPDEPQREHPDPERAGCPDGDDDHDGVLNHADQCRAENQGPRPDPARPGCPIPDRDHDTVPDASDHCPDQPGAPNPDPNLNGCPGLVRVTEAAIQIVTPVFFATNRDTILARSNPVLTAVANALRASPQIRRVSIEGHTDDQGPDARNMSLSERRAASVMTWLIAHGVEAGRLEAHGFGETRPQTPVTGLRGRALREARAANRRVEFRIVDPAPANAASGGAPTPAPATSTPATPAPAPSTPATPAPRP